MTSRRSSAPFLAISPKAGIILAMVWVVANTALFGAWLHGVHGPVRTYTLAASDLRHDQGCTYIARIDKRPLGWPFLKFKEDSPGNNAARLVLSEDGRPVPNPHASREIIASPRSPGYFYSGKELSFATADCSDPRFNGRRYQVSIPLSLSSAAYGLIFLGWLFLALALTRYCARDSSSSAFCRISRNTAALLFAPTDLVPRARLSAAVALAMITIACGYIIWIWGTGTSTSYAVAGFLPFSDASGNWICANSLLDTGALGYLPGSGEFCERRAIYPTLLAGVNLLGGRQIWYVLLLQALLVTGAAFILVRRFSSHIPGVATLASAGLLLVYGMNYASTRTMTENAGLLFGCLALALLIVAAEKRSLPWVLAGSALLSVALSARAGALFALPALVLWAGIVAIQNHRRASLWVATTAIAVLAGFVMQAGLLLAVGADLGTSQGNFSYTLYGLAVGGLGWQQVKIDHPEVMLLAAGHARYNAIYALAWQHLTTEPGLLLVGLAKNIQAYLVNGSFGYSVLGPAASLAKFFWWLAWLPMILRFRNPLVLLVAVLSLGVAASAPVLMSDGGPRVFAATVAVDVAQIAIGIGALVAAGIAAVTWVCHLDKGIQIPGYDQASPPERGVILDTTAALLALGILFLPLTPLARAKAKQAVVFNGCEDGQEAVVTRVNRGGTVTLSIVGERQSAGIFNGVISRDDLANGSPWPWIAELYSDLPPTFSGRSLLLAFRPPADIHTWPSQYFGYADIDLSAFDGKLIALCGDGLEPRRLFDRPYLKLRFATELETPP